MRAELGELLQECDACPELSAPFGLDGHRYCVSCLEREHEQRDREAMRRALDEGREGQRAASDVLGEIAAACRDYGYDPSGPGSLALWLRLQLQDLSHLREQRRPGSGGQTP